MSVVTVIKPFCSVETAIQEINKHQIPIIKNILENCFAIFMLYLAMLCFVLLTIHKVLRLSVHLR